MKAIFNSLVQKYKELLFHFDVGVSMAWESYFKVFDSFFYVLIKILSGKLSCTIDRCSCLLKDGKRLRM